MPAITPLTTAGTLAPGASNTFGLRPGSTLRLAFPPNSRATVTEVPLQTGQSDTSGKSDTRVTRIDGIAQTLVVGPYTTGGNVTVAMASNSSASVTWTQMETVALGGGTGVSKAVRIFAHRFGTLDNTTNKTFHVAMELQQHFDAVSLILCNTSQETSNYFICKVSTAAELGDGNNSAGTWINAPDEAGDTALPTNIAKPGKIAYRLTRPVSIKSLPRTDGGSKPLLFARTYCLDAVASLPVYGNGTSDVYTNWASRADGRIWLSRQMNGDGITTPSTFTSTTNTSQSPIVGVVYWARGRVVSLMAVGDSLADGRGTYIGEGWGVPLANQMSTQLVVPVEYSNCATAGQVAANTTTGAGFMYNALEILRNPVLRPDLLCMPVGSYNGATAPLTQAFVDGQSSMMRRVVETAAVASVPLMLYTWSAWTSGGWNASDALRRAYNAECLTQFAGAKGVSIADYATEVAGGFDANGQEILNPAYEDDDVHPNDAGNAVLAATGLPVAVSAIAKGA